MFDVNQANFVSDMLLAAYVAGAAWLLAAGCDAL